MPEYKLHYFSLRGRGEPIRVMLKLAGVKYTEVLYDWASEEWANAKKDYSKYAFGTMPVLEIDGTPISQTMAILRYLGKELGYAPDGNLQQAKADAIADECQDIVSKYLWQYFLETVPERKITYADIAFFCTFNDYVAGGKAEVPSQFENCPMATSLYERILNEPNVAAHIKSRPDTIV